jgi:hypothetical protein
MPYSLHSSSFSSASGKGWSQCAEYHARSPSLLVLLTLVLRLPLSALPLELTCKGDDVPAKLAVLVGSEDLRAGRNNARLLSSSLRAEIAIGLSLIDPPVIAVPSGLMLDQGAKGVSSFADANMAASSSGETIVSVSPSKVDELWQAARGVETFELESERRAEPRKELEASK